MTFIEKHRFAGGRSERELLKLSWEGEIFGVGLFETMADRYREYADVLTASATMEWLNVHTCEAFGQAAGVHVSLEQAEKLGREGATFAQRHSFEQAAKVTIAETPAADALYALLRDGARTPELKAFGEDLVAHENAIREWFRSVLDGKTDGGAQIFAFLERHGITRAEAVTPRKVREGWGGETQHLVLAFFANEDAADRAAAALKQWEQATEYLKLDAIVVLVKDKQGVIKEHKLGRRERRAWGSASP
jgi:hypothetical protein